jgi:glycosyltransferase involved in cell wall biosynthesis
MSKIAFFLPSLAGGGAEKTALVIGAGFLERGHQVDIVLAKAQGELMSSVPPEAKVLNLGAFRTLAALPGLTAYLRREKPEALISFPDVANAIAIWAKMLSSSQTKVLIGVHNHLSDVIKNSSKLQEKIYPALLRIFYRHAAVVMAISNGVAEDVVKVTGIPRHKIIVIYNPIPVSNIIRLKSESIDHPWFVPEQPPVILSVGRLVKQKDYPTLLNAFALVRKHRQVRLVILGEGELHNRVLDWATKLGIVSDVDLPGFVHNPYSYMSRCSVFVLSSAWEGFGNVLAEALACGTQVVSTDCQSGPDEILENGRYGRLVPVGDHVAMAEAIETALDHPLPPEALQARARAFSVESAVKKYLNVLGLS